MKDHKKLQYKRIAILYTAYRI